jgi:Flp pilus assembly pilin Flp
MKGIIKNTEGAAAVEFAIIAMVLFMVILGIIEFGLLLYNNTMLTHASRVAARTGVMYAYSEDADGFYYTHLDDSAILEAAETFWRDRFITFGDRTTAFNSEIQRLRPPDYTTPVSYGSEHSKDLLEVALTYEYDFLLLKVFGLGPINLRARTSMRFE